MSMTGWWHPIYAITDSDWWLAHCSPLLGICGGGVCVYVYVVVVVVVTVVTPVGWHIPLPLCLW